MKVDILGEEWTITVSKAEDDSLLKDYDGYADKTSRKIVIKAKDDDCDLDNFEWYQKKVLRHEIIHAFLYESGLAENFEHHNWGHDETTIDWVAYQFPKMLTVFEKVGCL